MRFFRRKPAEEQPDEMVDVRWFDVNWLLERIVRRDQEIDHLCIMRERTLELFALMLGETVEDADRRVTAIRRARDAAEMEEAVLRDIQALPGEDAA